MNLFSKKNLTNSNLVTNLALVVLLLVYLLQAFFPVILESLSFIIDILSPFFIALILYYLLRPFVFLLEKKMPVWLAIFITYIFFTAALVFIVIFIYPAISTQITLLKSVKLSNIVNMDENSLTFFNRYHFNFSLPEAIKTSFNSMLAGMNTWVIEGVTNLVSSLTKFVFALVLAPFILYYFLKDDHRIYEGIISKVPKKYLSETKTLCYDIDTTLMHFINGRFIISAITSFIAFISFLILGLDYPFVLAMICLIFYIIPTVGAIMALVLPIVVGFSMSLFMGFAVLSVMLIINTLEGFVVTPQVLGKKLYIHSLTMIFILIVGGSMGGILGLLFVTPLYVLLKIMIGHIYLFYSQEEAEES